MNDVGLLIVSFVVLLLARVPVAFALGFSAAVTMMLSIPLEPSLVTVSQRLATSLDSFALLAIPLFILAGELMNRGGIARRLVDLARLLVGRLPHGLAHVHILASMLFGAISGSAVAAASSVGGVLGPRMLEEGYSREEAAAVNIASATTGLVIPPSNILIVYSLASGGVSIAALFLAGYLPGILIGVMLMITSAFVLKRRGDEDTAFGSSTAAMARPSVIRTLLEALPCIGLPVVVMGGIIGGVFTATEASGIAVVYALLLALAYRELRLTDLAETLMAAGRTTGIVMLLVGTSVGLSWVLAYDRVPQDVAEALMKLSDEPIMVLLIINLTLLTVGTVMDMTPAVLIFTPIFLPVVRELGVDPVHFGILMVMNLCIGLCTPPVGTVLFVGCAVGKTNVVDVVRPLLPLYGAMVVALVIVVIFPELSLWLPALLAD